MGAWDKYDNTKVNKKSAWSDYDKSNQPKQPSTLSKVASGVGNFAVDIGKDALGSLLVKPAARATEAITRTLAPNSLAAKGYESMADSGTSQKILGVDVNPVKAFGQGGGKQITGEALNTASWLIGTGGGAKVAKQALTKTAQLAAKKTFAEIAVKQIPELTKLGLATSAAGTFGNQLQKTAGTDEKIDWGQAAKDIALGTLITPVVGIAAAKLFGTKASKILEARQALRDAEIASNKVRIDAMPIGTKLDNIKPNLADNSFANIPKENPNITVAPGARFITPEVKPTNPLETRATQFKTSGDFIGNEVAFMNRTKQEVTPSFMKKLDDTWNKMHPAPVQEKIPTGTKPISQLEQKSISPETPTQPTIEQPRVDTNSPEFKQKVKESYDKLNEANPEEFNAKTHEIYANKFALDYMSDPAKVERIALGLEQHPDGAAFSDAYNALLSNEASKSGNIDLIEKLSDSSVSSISGQKLEANKLRLKDNVVDVIKKVKQGKFNELPDTVKKVFTQEENAGRKLINNEIATFKPTKEIIGQLVDSLICK